MPLRHFPVHPDLGLLQRQAEDLLAAFKHGEPDAVTTMQESSTHVDALAADLPDAQLALAQSYGLPSWERLTLACRVTDAIWADDAETVRTLMLEYPVLLEEDARGIKGNWGPPMSYAANVGRTHIVRMLRDMGAADVQFAFERACLQGKLETARLLNEMGGQPRRGSIMGPCETLNPAGLELLLALGAEVCDENGDPFAPVALVLETYCRNPVGKHGCLEILAEHGVHLPDTPPMAVHRGRIDLLERHLASDSGVLQQRFAHNEIYPPAAGCHEDHSLALHGTPVAGGTLLHLAVDCDELDIAEWLLAHGADVNAAAAIDSDGFGGHTALFGCVVSQPYCSGRRTDDLFARLLLDNGADPNRVASLRKRLRFVEDETEHCYRDVTPLGWGQQFHHQDWVSPSVVKAIADRGGHL